jgi:hypothetical protein
MAVQTKVDKLMITVRARAELEVLPERQSGNFASGNP